MRVSFEHLRDVMNPVQYALRKWGYSERDRILLEQGGAGSGKSWGIGDLLHYWAMSEGEPRKRHNIVIIRKVGKTNRLSTWRLMESIFTSRNTSPLWDKRKSDMEMTCLNGARINFLGLDDPEKLKSIEGVDTVWCEEATELSREDVEEINRRLRGNYPFPKRLILSYNPVSVRNSIYRMFFEDHQPNTRLVKTTWRDNRYLDEESRRVLTGYRDGSNADIVYNLGQWGRLEGLVYDHPETVKGFPVCDTLAYGLDFGYNNPTTLIKIGIRGEDDLFIDELLYERNLTEDDLKKRLSNLHLSNDIVIWADSEAPGTIETLRRAGFNVRPVNKTKYKVTEGIALVKARKWHVTERSINVLREVDMYQWDTSGKAEKDTPIKNNDHAMDAIRYAVMSSQSGNQDVYFF